jgi:hypothetical protein
MEFRIGLFLFFLSVAIAAGLIIVGYRRAGIASPEPATN